MNQDKPPRRPPRWFKRRQYFEARIAAAETGPDALVEAIRWLKSEAYKNAEAFPKDADALYRMIAEGIGKYAASIPRARPPRA